MMFCYRCRRELAVFARVCPQCGTRMDLSPTVTPAPEPLPPLPPTPSSPPAKPVRKDIGWVAFLVLSIIFFAVNAALARLTGVVHDSAEAEGAALAGPFVGWILSLVGRPFGIRRTRLCVLIVWAAFICMSMINFLASNPSELQPTTSAPTPSGSVAGTCGAHAPATETLSSPSASSAAFLADFPAQTLGLVVTCPRASSLTG